MEPKNPVQDLFEILMNDAEHMKLTEQLLATLRKQREEGILSFDEHVETMQALAEKEDWKGVADLGTALVQSPLYENGFIVKRMFVHLLISKAMCQQEVDDFGLEEALKGTRAAEGYHREIEFQASLLKHEQAKQGFKLGKIKQCNDMIDRLSVASAEAREKAAKRPEATNPGRGCGTDSGLGMLQSLAVLAY